MFEAVRPRAFNRFASTMKRKAGSSSSETGRVAKVQPERYEAQLREKVDSVRRTFSGVSPLPEMKVFRSPATHYRLRAEFRVFHDGGDSYYAMYEKGEGDAEPKLTRKDAFPAASLLVNELMAALIERVKGSQVMRRRLYTATFHTTLSGQAMVTLVYHRKLGDDWREEADRIGFDLARECQSCASDRVNIVGRVPSALGLADAPRAGRSRKQKVVAGEDFVTERLTAGGRSFSYKQMEGGFAQPNGRVCEQMLSWALSATEGGRGDEDLLELYCGNCNFTVPLSLNFRRVVATEVSRASVQAGRDNLRANGVANVSLARMSSEEFVAKWRSGDLGRRLGNLQSSELNLSTIFVDPPRSGLDDDTVELLKEFDNVLYVSCNPATLRSNIASLLETHSISNFALFDQFPYTGHIECGINLNRKDR